MDLITLSREELLQRVPHGTGALLLDSARLTPGACAVADVTLCGGEAFFHDHYPGWPVLPGHVLLELLGQTGALLVSSLPDVPAGVMLLAGVERMRFVQPVVPPCGLRLIVEVDAVRLGIVRLEARAERADGGIVAHASLSVAPWRRDA